MEYTMTKKQVVEALGVAPRTLDLWIQKSLIAKQDRRGAHGVQSFFAPEEVERVKRERSRGRYDGSIADPSITPPHTTHAATELAKPQNTKELALARVAPMQFADLLADLLAKVAGNSNGHQPERLLKYKEAALEFGLSRTAIEKA